MHAERDAATDQIAWLYASLTNGDEQAERSLPPDPGPGRMSINDPLPIGTYADGTDCEIQLGHTNVLFTCSSGDDINQERFVRVLIAQLARCNDTLIWFAAPDGLRQAAPWLAANPNHSTLDWVATDPDEIELMLQSGLRLASQRSTSGPSGDRAQPSVDIPAVVIIIPDAASVLRLTGSRQHRTIAQTALELAQVGRREAITLALGTRTETLTTGVLMEHRQ